MTRVLLDIKATRPMLGDLLNKRYRVVQVLSSGAFGRTYIAEDASLPNSPKCIIRHLKPPNNDPNLLPFVKNLFLNEAKTLESLGQHDQTPKLLAFFEDNQGYYLVQEFIQGQLLSALVPLNQRIGKRWTENQVIQLLQEVLPILEFFHGKGIVHCDIKPNHLIKRASDGKICLIDFGAVQPNTRLKINETNQTNVKYNMPPAGYIPAEQVAYQPQPNSDIFALGMIAIQALTGIHPTELELNSNTGEIAWQEQVEVSDELASVLNKMVRYSYEDRYQTATEALFAVWRLTGLKNLPIPIQEIQNIEPIFLGSNIFEEPETREVIQDLEELLDLTVPSVSDENIIPSAVTNTLGTIPNNRTKPVLKSRKITPAIAAFGVGMAVNASVMIAGFIYISQPDPSQYKQVDEVLNKLPWDDMAEKVCDLPVICFWQNK